MGLLRERSRQRDWGSVPGFGRAFKFFGGKSILRTPRTEVKVKYLKGHDVSFIVAGKMRASADDSSESILRRIVKIIDLSRNEQSGGRISRNGKDLSMAKAISYNEDDIPTLSEESLQHLEGIKKRAALRKASRMAKEEASNHEVSLAHSMQRKAARISSRRGKLIEIS